MREWLGFYLDAQVVNALISQGESCTLVEAERPVIGGNDLVLAIHKSSLGFPADKLVELGHESEICTPQAPTLNVDRVVYKESIYEILPFRVLPNSSPSGCVSGLAFT